MITAEDYNISPLSVNQEIVKIKALIEVQVELADILI
jgi:hypothetical protein